MRRFHTALPFSWIALHHLLTKHWTKKMKNISIFIEIKLRFCNGRTEVCQILNIGNRKWVPIESIFVTECFIVFSWFYIYLRLYTVQHPVVTVYSPFHTYTFSNPLFFIVYLSKVFFFSFTSMCLAFSFPEQKGQFPLCIPLFFFVTFLISSLSRLSSFFHFCYGIRCNLPCPAYVS
jgi:hypothetical protein